MTSPYKTPSGIAAATVVIFRRGADGGAPELLMVVRSKALRFAGGAAVFPGGRVDEADRTLASQLDSALPIDEVAHRIAAMRETLEETGLVIAVREPVSVENAIQARQKLADTGALCPVLEAMGWTLDMERLLPFARWFPQGEKLTRVFDTRFYLADLGTGAVDIAVDKTENTRAFWTTAQGALDMAEQREISVIFPTRRNLERLACFSDFDAARLDSERYPARTIVPFLSDEDDGRWLRIPDDAGYPVTGERLDSAKRQ
ncbi:MAG: NUDIX domain-containing protein [Parerythrobacter sp.]